VRLGRSEHEHHTRRRLLQNFEQCVPGFPGEHVSFVYDVDLVVPFLRRRVHGTFPELSCILYTAIARGIDLHDIDIGGAIPNSEAVLALTTGLARWIALGAVERHRQNPGGGGLADAPRPGQEIAVTHASPSHCSAEDGNDVVLNQEIGEALGTVSAGEGDWHWAISCGPLAIG
jgi:hypothetical protein